MAPDTPSASMPLISRAEARLMAPAYKRFLYEQGLEDTPERFALAATMWRAGGASTIRRGASIGNALLTMSQFVDLLRESENGSAYWHTRDDDDDDDDIADEMGVDDSRMSANEFRV